MSSIAKLYDATKVLYDHLQQLPDEDSREPYIEQINDMLDKRDVIIKEVKAPSTDEERELGTEIQKLDHDIRIKLKTLFNQINMDLNKLKKQKNTHQKYTNPYAATSNMDGTFFDKKK
ncbi:flagellar protein [Bacillus salitolerans]|uniref:Flagellar protein FliT n=1 Tax=Bacillus salitolerans TaxID=1437434 RepID=A0ABW4LRN8_9BACI